MRLPGIVTVVGLALGTALAVEVGLLPLEWWAVSGAVGGVAMAATKQVEACPNCDTTMGNLYRRDTLSPPWRCLQCGATFDAPVERPAKPPGQALAGDERVREVLAIVARLRADLALDHIKIDNIAARTNFERGEISYALDILADRGYLKYLPEWSATHVWRIEPSAFDGGEGAVGEASD